VLNFGVVQSVEKQAWATGGDEVFVVICLIGFIIQIVKMG